ncbi:hypothetical protein GCS56_002615 [Vibrio metschnikovii]|nr:hypothetical protein [Vibrio metschnikovii]EKO3610138.1 hypothetical protein [Vibrio metschnikovii]EKO3683106.1 hypothetical protein [Vibrio metschnikovii]EKO3713398.1 hypothetical protein [Vibrio metschnikovii]EKO3738702.1 hypothetical protein [Vibrio metschnikovii]
MEKDLYPYRLAQYVRKKEIQQAASSSHLIDMNVKDVSKVAAVMEKV